MMHGSEDQITGPPPIDPQSVRDLPPVPGYHYEWVVDTDWEVPALRSTAAGQARKWSVRMVRDA